ncbi:MAG: popeye domain-containing protein [Deltaproteobacteria bacterium]|nr:popeye domain-containing protein [Deltaproteobacteria bacterium]
MDVFIHIANVLFLASYSVRDILWLRLLSVVGTLSLMPYYAANGLIPPIYWNSAFLVINGFQIYKLLMERRPVRLTVEQQRLYAMGFDRLTPRDFLRLLELATWVRVAEPTRLAEQGEPLDRLTVLAEGQAKVSVGGAVVSTLGPGQFVGEMSYITGQPACAQVVVESGGRCVHWPRAGLRKFLEDRADVRAALQNIMGTDLASKLRRDAVLASA